MDAQKKGPATAAGSCRVVDELSLLFDISYTLESSLELRDVIRPVLLKMAEGLCPLGHKSLPARSEAPVKDAAGEAARSVLDRRVSEGHAHVA